MEKTKKELEEQLMEMPELDENEISELTEQEKFMYGYLPQEEKEIIKRMNNINTFQAHENEVCLRGTDEEGNDFTVWWDSYDFLGWIDIQNVQYIKEQLTKYIEEK